MSNESTSATDDTASIAGSVSLSDLECAVCADVFYDPITLPQCGHTIDRHCLHRSLQLKPQCPLCRAPCTIDPHSFPTSSLLSNLVERLFPIHHSRRRQEVHSERRVRKDRLGIFISESVPFPGQELRLHIFEPKYRVMINRAMAYQRTFIVTQQTEINKTHNNQTETETETETHASTLHLPYAALMKINNCRASPDGRSLISSLCIGRVLMSALEEEEDAGFGLLTVETQRVEDVDTEMDIDTPDHKEQSSDQSSSSASPSESVIADYDCLYAALLQYCSSASVSIAHLCSVYGDLPNTPHLRQFTWWVGRAVPHSSAQHSRLLHSVGVKDRLSLCLEICREAKATEREKATWQARAVIVIALFAFLLHLWHR